MTDNILYDSAQYFHEVYPPSRDSVTTLKGNSANSKFIVYESTEASNKFIIKVQFAPDDDPIVNDSLICYILRIALDKKYAKYFMQFHGSFLTLASTDHTTYYSNQPDNVESESLDLFPSIVLSEVQKPVPLYKIVEKPEQFKRVLPKLANLIHCLLNLGGEFGFAHHDLHLGNVLYNTVDKNFVLIDYGRAHIPSLFDERQYLIDQYISSEESKFMSWSEHWDWFFSNPYYDYTNNYRIPKSNYVGKEIYILNDLAGFSVIINDHFEIDYKTHIKVIKEKTSGVTDELEKTAVIAKYLRQLDQLDFTIIVGLVWFDALNTEYNKYKTLDQNAKKLIYKRHRCNCLIDRDQFDIIKFNMQTYYISEMKYFIKAWKYVKTRYMYNHVGGRLQDKVRTDSKFDNMLSGVKNINITKQIETLELESYKDEPEFLESGSQVVLDILPDDTMYGEGYYKIIAARDALEAEMKAAKKVHASGGAHGSVKSKKQTKNKQLKKIYIEKDTKRKFVKVSNQKWYLDENRGKYKYSTKNGVKDTQNLIMK
jgi:preprotein translocase subunit YajC